MPLVISDDRLRAAGMRDREAKGKDSAGPLVDRLTSELKFFITPSLRRRIAELANE